jgi:hypothetical protein
MEEKKVVPFRTCAGVEIGKFYVPPEKKMESNPENELLQQALLHEEKKDRGYGSVGFYMAFVVVMIALELYFVITR